MTVKRLFFFWVMTPLDIVADIAALFHVPAPFEPCTFGVNMPGPASQKKPLSFSQIAWCDKNLRHFKSMREQAEAARAK